MHGCTQGSERTVAAVYCQSSCSAPTSILNLAQLFTVWSSLLPKGVPDHTIGFDVTSRRRAMNGGVLALRRGRETFERPLKIEGHLALFDDDRFGKDSWTPLVCCGASI
jgi:hypothetical protein